MTTTPLSAVEVPANVPLLPVRTFRVRTYHRTIEAAILGRDDDVDFTERWTVPRMQAHASAWIARDWIANRRDRSRDRR